MIQRIAAILFVLVSSVALLGCENDLLEPVSQGSIEGQVLDAETNQPLPGAGITTTPPTSSLISDNEGRFQLERVAAGNYTITARLHGYDTNATTVSVRDGEATAAIVFLEESVLDTTSTADFEASVLGFSNSFRDDSAFVVVEYRARNTGAADIGLYEIYFQLMTNGSTYFHEVSGSNLLVGQSDISQFERYVGTDSVTVVEIGDVYFEGQ